MTDEQPPQYDIDWVKTLAGALAAVTTAVILSTLGAVGTLIGAALGSVAATVGSALYAQGLARSRRAVLHAQEVALSRVSAAQTEVRRAARPANSPETVETHLEHAGEQLAEARSELEPEPAPAAAPTLRDRFVALPWKRIAVLAAATFLVVMLVITGFEKLSGRSVSSYTGGSGKDSGSTVPGVNGGGGKDKPVKSPSPSPSQTTTPSETPSETPTEEPTPSEEPTESATPSETPTEEPSDTSVPTPTATP